jgi:hypothetical protein
MNGMERIMRKSAMRDNRTTTSKRQSLRSWRTFRRKVAQALPSLLFGLAVGMLQGCGEGGVSDLVGVNSATLTWEKPTTNQDGSPLTDLAGYQIYYGQTTPVTTDNSQLILVLNPNQISYVVANLAPGTYHFTVTAVNLQGSESTMANEVIKTID